MKDFLKNIKFLLGKKEISKSTLLPFDKIILDFLKEFS